jgi:flagella basal body P-ring formation protein FlgA
LSLAAAVFAGSAPATGADLAYQPLESISGAIRRFLESNSRHAGADTRIEIPPLDSRLQLALCSVPLEVFPTHGSRDIGNLSLGVRCSGDRPWTIYHRAYLGVIREVAVLAGAVKAGTVLGPTDVVGEPRDIAPLNGIFLSPEQVIGKPVKKALAAKTVLIPEMLTTLRLVRRGDQVTIRNNAAGLEVSMAGIALMDGERGQRIRVRNVQSGRVIQATVTGEGMVDINP